MDRTVKRPKLSDVLYADLLEQVRTSRLPPETRLPSEQQLADQFRVSRPIVREALRRLREEGVLISRKGSGSYVSGAAAQNGGARSAIGEAPPLLKSIADVQRFYTYRIMLEGEIAAEAAANIDASSRAAIESAMQHIETAMHHGDGAVYEDFEFHLAIAQATRNPFFVAALKAIQPALNYVIDLALSLSGGNPEEHDSLVLQDHRAVVDAIVRRDSAAARELMRTHIGRAYERVFLGVEPPKRG
jgi:DNA-binding FadR family transcriptional regulator